MLPLFENLQRYYPGNVDYGGAYSDYDVFKAVNLSSRTHNNDSCILRMSVALNLEEQENESKSKIRHWFFNRLQSVDVHVQA